MSGTSADGVDAAVAQLALAGDTLELTPLAAHTDPWPPELRRRILAAPEAGAAELCRLHRDLGAALGEVAVGAIDQYGPVDLLVSHGQTIHHEVGPDGAVHSTLQLGAAAQLAEQTGVPVVADLRTRDVAAGGQGAPLVSIVDELLLVGSADAGGPPGGDEPVAALNLGGIANLTVVRPAAPTLAFDCGPANALLDVAVARATGEPYDEGGALAARGTVDDRLLAVLLADPYLAAAPPKSTGRERYHAGYLDAALAVAPVLAPADLLATLAEFTAAAVAADVARYRVRRVFAAGGGVHNAGLLAALRRRLAAAGAQLLTTAQWGLPVDAREAYAFAVLGWLTWHGLPGTIPSCTGATGARVLGSITPGREPLRLPPPLPTPPRRALVRR
ncbi:anhydro-N-acetylmuramic acid kinase [Natronosporangium hydrolyticum]|uniref:Anhydro-N-acetylmuramic acid kinase n=2 Tax=Natronosporangium hydrolyticum TaxID=2811111 RepID=A0A895YSX6_9ACTN|nr:anhydro-N-acetylmuramic acid kinase [Natronosporangium hydrolyticum]